MGQRKISLQIGLILIGFIGLSKNCIYARCVTANYVDRRDHSCSFYEGGKTKLEAWRDTMSDGASKMMCCGTQADKARIMTEYKPVLTGCFPNDCHSKQLDNYCPETRQLNGKVYTFDEVVRNPCTKTTGEKGYQSTCCPKGSLESQLASTYGAEPNELPFIARYLPVECGGTIYNKRFVISAAHCSVDSKTFLEDPLDQGPAGKQRVVIGSNSFSRLDPSYEYIVKKVHVHENYTKVNPNQFKTNLMLNDLVLLELERDIEFGPNVMSLQLAPENFDPRLYADQAFIAGWGTTDALQQSQHLQKSNVLLRDPRNCFSRSQASVPLVTYDDFEQDQDQLLCVGGILNGKWSPTAGRGDSGGPAVCRGPSGTAVHCGVTSFSRGEDKNV